MAGSVEVSRDLRYTSESGGDNAFDLYLPSNASDPAPVVLWVHGGGFVSGDKRYTETYATFLASHGLAVMSINYDRAPERTIFDQTDQVIEALDVVEDLSQDYPIDTGRIVLAGSSAGGFTALRVALVQCDSSFAEQAEAAQVVPSSSIVAVLAYSAPCDITEFQSMKLESPIAELALDRLGWGIVGDRSWKEKDYPTLDLTSQVNESLPPMFVTDGNTNTFIDQNTALAEVLRHAGVDVTTLFFSESEGAVGHSYIYDMASEAGETNSKETIAFLEGAGIIGTD